MLKAIIGLIKLVGNLVHGMGIVIWMLVLMLPYHLLTAFVMMVAWNYVVTEVFSLPTINYWQALALRIFVAFLTLDVDFSKE